VDKVDAERVVRLVRAVVAVDELASRDEVTQAIADLAAIVRWCDGREVALAGYMAHHSPIPQKPIATAGRSMKKAKRALKRNETKKETPKLGEALEQGKVSGEHLDVAAGALAGVEADKRKELAKRIDAHAGDAEELSAEEFARLIRAEQQRMDDDEGEGRLARQQRAVRFNHRVDPATGMIEFWGKVDPLRGMKFLNQLKERVARLFADKTPGDCPSDPIEKNAYLQALALLDLCEGHGQRSGRPEVIVVVDTRDTDGGDGPHVDWGIPVELPVRVLTDLVRDADMHTVVVCNGAIVHAPGRVDLGRTTRLANVAQRRALRAIYPRCAIPDCPTRFDYCKIHHVHGWRHGGRTDLENLLPVCVRHHTAIHDDGWIIRLAPDRVLTLTLPNGEVMTTGPPSRRAA
jgi:HNH endonuclease